MAATSEPNNERKGKTNNTSANSSSQHRADHPHEVDAASSGGRRQAVVTVVGAPRSPDITDRRPPDRSVSRDGSVGSPSHGP